MPWIALDDGEKVVPEETEDKKTVICPDCEGEMVPRGPTSDGRARHFVHKSEGGGSGGSSCGGGESDTHRRWKSFTKSKLKQILPSEFVESIEIEKTIPLFDQDSVSMNIKKERSGKNRREADVFLSLSEDHPKIGKGVAIEVQYKNKSKDIAATEADYLSQGVSVLWLDSTDFTEDRCILTKKRLFEGVVGVFPSTIPDKDEWERLKFDPANAVARHSKGNLDSTIDRSALNYPVGIPDAEIDVILPKEWYGQASRRCFRDTPWGQLFTARSHESFTNELKVGSNHGESDATIHLKKWLSQDERAIATFYGGYKRGSSTPLYGFLNYDVLSKGYITNTVGQANFIRSADIEIPFETHSYSSSYDYETLLLPDEGLVELIESPNESGKETSTKEPDKAERIDCVCPNCGDVKQRLAIHSGENHRSTSCGSCGEWYTVYSEANGLENANEVKY